MSPGNWNSVLGTTLALKGVTKELVHDPLGVVYSHRAPNGGWLPGGALEYGGRGHLQGLRRQGPRRARPARGPHEPAAAVGYPLASRGAVSLRRARGGGLHPRCGIGEADRYAAMLQGVGFIERLCFDYLDLLGAEVSGDLTFTGGATRAGTGASCARTSSVGR